MVPLKSGAVLPINGVGDRLFGAASSLFRGAP